MKTITFSIITIVIINFVFSSCSKKSVSPVAVPPKDTVVIVKEVPIGAQTLAEAKATFQGKWKLQYRFGGYTGTVYTYYPNTIMLFTSSDSLYRWDDNVLKINSPVSYTYSSIFIANYSTYMINIQYPANTMDALQIAYAKKGDTLILAEPHVNTEKYFLTKLP